MTNLDFSAVASPVPLPRERPAMVPLPPERPPQANDNAAGIDWTAVVSPVGRPAPSESNIDWLSVASPVAPATGAAGVSAGVRQTATAAPVAVPSPSVGGVLAGAGRALASGAETGAGAVLSAVAGKPLAEGGVYERAAQLGKAFGEGVGNEPLGIQPGSTDEQAVQQATDFLSKIGLPKGLADAATTLALRAPAAVMDGMSRVFSGATAAGYEVLRQVAIDHGMSPADAEALARDLALESQRQMVESGFKPTGQLPPGVSGDVPGFLKDADAARAAQPPPPPPPQTPFGDYARATARPALPPPGYKAPVAAPKPEIPNAPHATASGDASVTPPVAQPSARAPLGTEEPPVAPPPEVAAETPPPPVIIPPQRHSIEGRSTIGEASPYADSSRGSDQSGKNARVSKLAGDEGSLLQSGRPSLPALRGPGDRGLPRVGEHLPSVSEGHGAAPARAIVGSQGQQQGIQPVKLPMGDHLGAGAEYDQNGHPHTPGQEPANFGVGEGARLAGQHDRDAETAGLLGGGVSQREGNLPPAERPSSTDLPGKNAERQRVGEGVGPKPVLIAGSAEEVATRKGARTKGIGKAAVNRGYDVPYLAGSNEAGGTTYIDRRVPTSMTIKGKTFDPAKYLAVHEQWEHDLMMKQGKPYEVAHRAALAKEKHAVEADGINWNGYQAEMHKLAEQVTEPETVKRPPPDIYTKPYPHAEAEFLKRKAETSSAQPVKRAVAIQPKSKASPLEGEILPPSRGVGPAAPRAAKGKKGQTLGSTAERAVTQTPAFKEWFGDSKVVDGEGRPLVVYHGTAGNFESFDPASRGRNVTLQTNAANTFSFTDRPEQAEFYANQADRIAVMRVKEAQSVIDRETSYIDRNNLVRGQDGVARTLTGSKNFGPQERLERAEKTVRELSGSAPNLMPVYLRMSNPRRLDWAKSQQSIDKLVALAKAEGRDGIIITNIGGVAGETKVSRGGDVLPTGTYYQVFSPEQIKSVANRGTFDRTNPNILAESAQRPSAPRVKLDPRQLANLERTMSNIVSRVGGKDIKISFEPTLPREEGAIGPEYEAGMKQFAAAGGRVGATMGGEITFNSDGEAFVRLATQDPKFNPRDTAYHEAYHRAEAALMTDKEFAAVSDESQMAAVRKLAADALGLRQSAADALPGYEARAIAFQEYARRRDAGEAIDQRTFAGNSALRRWFERLRNIIASLRRMLTNKGFTKFSDVFEEAYKGKMAEREPGYRDIIAKGSTAERGTAEPVQPSAPEAKSAKRVRPPLEEPFKRHQFRPETTPTEPAARPKAEPAAKPAERPSPRTEPRTPPTAEPPKPSFGEGVSKIGKSIEAKAIEAKLTNGFEGTAGYDKITIKDQAKRATTLINESLDEARATIRGEKPLPEGLRGTALITAMEEYIKANPSGELAYELANSPLVSATSAAAQEMRLMSERTPDSAMAKLQEIKAALVSKVGGEKKLATKRAAVVKGIKAETSKINLSKAELSWNNFLKSIEC